MPRSARPPLAWFYPQKPQTEFPKSKKKRVNQLKATVGKPVWCAAGHHTPTSSFASGAIVIFFGVILAGLRLLWMLSLKFDFFESLFLRDTHLRLSQASRSGGRRRWTWRGRAVSGNTAQGQLRPPLWPPARPATPAHPSTPPPRPRASEDGERGARARRRRVGVRRAAMGGTAAPLAVNRDIPVLKLYRTC